MSTQPSGDEFMNAMWQHMQLMNNEATKKLNELRREITELRKELIAAKLRYYELQAENIAMQDELASRTPISMSSAICDAM